MSKKGTVLGLAAVFILVGIMVFHALWPEGAVLQTTDGNIGQVAYNQRMLKGSPVVAWMGETLWGLPNVGGAGLRLWGTAIALLSPRAFMNYFYSTCLVLAAWFLSLYLRDKGLRAATCVFGGLVAFWVGTNMTLTYAGHLGKSGVMVFLALAIFALGRWGKTGRAAWSVVGGAATGAMFWEQADVALFCALLLVPLGLFEASRAAGGWAAGKLIKQSYGAILAAALLAGGAAISSVGAGVTQVPGAESKDAGWAYITQWSQPPGESLDFIAPGWTGWRSGDPEGPYWGKMGRSDDWEQTRQGFMNFKLENVYVGAMPLLFALLAVVESVRRRREDERAPAVWLWGGLCLAALLLSFGKFFPLYKLVSLLPGFSSIRNPNKFIHFFQMSWGVLAAFGLEAALRMEGRMLKRWLWGAGIAAGVFFLAGSALWADLGAGAEQLAAAGWGAAGRAIQWNKAFSITYAGVALALGAGILWVFTKEVFHSVENPAAAGPQHGKKGGDFPQRGKSGGGRTTVWKTFGAWLPALVVTAEAALILAPHYIQTMPPGYVAENDLVRGLKAEMGEHRMALATQDGFYNFWLTYLFPYHGIPSVNVTQLPRPPPDYSAFWKAMQDPVRMWRLTAVSHVLAHTQVAQQLRANPAWAQQLEVDWQYQPQDDGQGGISTRRVPAGQAAQETVLKLVPTPPRVVAEYAWREAADDEALRTLADPAFVPFSMALLAPDSGVPAAPPLAPGTQPAQVNVEQIQSGHYEFSVENAAPALVRVAEKYDPGWQARVDGKPVPVVRTDFMFQGIYLSEPGRHAIELRYATNRIPIVLQSLGLLMGLGAVLWLLAGLFRRGGAEGSA